MDALELLRPRNRFTETLPSGLEVTLRLPRLRDCIRAGRVPLPVLQHVQELAEQDSTDDIPDDEVEAMSRFQDQIVLRSVVEIEGQEVEMSLEAVAEFQQTDYDRIVAIATRQVALPKGPTPGTSPSSPPPSTDGPSLASSNGGAATRRDSSSPSTTSSLTTSERPS